jgi:hypothetical protein
MNIGRTAMITVATALAAALVGCSSNTETGPIASATTATTTSPSPSAAASTSLDPAAKEAQDRQDAEIVWRKFDALTFTIAALAAEQLEPAIAQVAVDPAASQLRGQYAKLKAQQHAGYGQDISYVSWPEPIAGRDSAVLHDCQDGSQAGFLDARNGNKLTMGTPNTPVRGTVQRTPAGWRVANIEILSGVTCTPGRWNA